MERIPVIDVDFHPMPRHWDQEVAKFIPARWRDYIASYGLGQGGGIYTGSPPQREFTHRLDAIDRSGRVGTDPMFAKEQVLDQYDLTAAILTCVSPFPPCGPNRPLELAVALNQAFNDCIAETWCAADPRYYSAIALSRDLPDIGREIRRCKEGTMGDRFVEVLISPAGAEPLGKQRYWPLFEACVEYDLPVACHVPPTGPKGTAGGATTYYCELHMNLAAYPMTIIPSMIFEGVFDRFPRLEGRNDRVRLVVGVPSSRGAWTRPMTCCGASCRICSASRPSICASISGTRLSRSRSPRTAGGSRERVSHFRGVRLRR